MAPALFIRFMKIPIIKTGKIDEAARPKAMATVPAAKSGGCRPRYPAAAIAPAIAKRQAEMLAEAMGTVSTAAQQLAGAATNPQEMTSKQAELTREALEKALANMRELAEMVGKSNSEAFQLMNTRFSESLQDLKGLTEAKK